MSATYEIKRPGASLHGTTVMKFPAGEEPILNLRGGTKIIDRVEAYWSVDLFNLMDEGHTGYPTHRFLGSNLLKSGERGAVFSGAYLSGSDRPAKERIREIEGWVTAQVRKDQQALLADLRNHTDHFAFLEAQR